MLSYILHMRCLRKRLEQDLRFRSLTLYGVAVLAATEGDCAPPDGDAKAASPLPVVDAKLFLSCAQPALARHG